MPSDKFIAIGIDFGTTFSGVSWAYSEDPDLIHEVRHWPATLQAKDEIQVPTTFDVATNQFGYMIPQDVLPIRWFKLLLLEGKDDKYELRSCEYLVDAKRKLKEQGLDVIDLIANYLRKIWDHALAEIETEIDIDALPLRVALTIPAIWPQYAREKMKEAAQRAGIMRSRFIGETTFNLIEEPEAAAIAALFERKRYPEIAVGEIFIVCDCGGGTVDIISYKIKSLEPFRVEEAAKGDGRLCGAFLIDDAFENWMQVKSGLKFDQRRAPKQEVRQFVNEDWEIMKRAFRGDETGKEFTLRLPSKVFSLVKRARGNCDSYSLKKETVRQFFSKTYDGIRQLISAQRQEIQERHGKEPKASEFSATHSILIVYIYDMLQKQYQNVLQPSRAWSVVARGAVISVLRNTFSGKEFDGCHDNRVIQTLHSLPEISGKVSRFNYGVNSGVLVSQANPPVDYSCDEVTKRYDGSWEVWRMRWYLRQGDTVDNKNPVTYDFFQVLKEPANAMANIKIIICDAAEAPLRKDHTCKQLCDIGCALEVPWDELRVIGPRERVIDGISLTMRFEGEPKWSLKAGRGMVEADVNVQYTGGSY